MIPGIYKCFEKWCGQTVWIYSDPHFNDAELQKLFPNRPTAEEQIKMINSKVGRKDTIIILGDIGDIECIKKLRGYKVLIAGNHDIGLSTYQHQIYIEKFDKDKFTKEQALETMKNSHPNCKYSINEGCDFHASFEYWEISADNMLFDETYGGALFIGEKILLSHEPIEGIPFALNIHGHDHMGKRKDANHLNVCSDVIGYTPINLNQMMKSGPTSKIPSIHRVTINKATVRAKKRKTKTISSK